MNRMVLGGPSEARRPHFSSREWAGTPEVRCQIRVGLRPLIPSGIDRSYWRVVSTGVNGECSALRAAEGEMETRDFTKLRCTRLRRSCSVPGQRRSRGRSPTKRVRVNRPITSPTARDPATGPTPRRWSSGTIKPAAAASVRASTRRTVASGGGRLANRRPPRIPACHRERSAQRTGSPARDFFTTRLRRAPPASSAPREAFLDKDAWPPEEQSLSV
jgi:hypothetical protein